MAALKDTASVESTLAMVLRHPIRVQAMTILTERVASPKDIAHEIGDTIGNVSYHIRELRKGGLLEVVGEKRVRGAVQTFYRACKRPSFTDKEWAALPVAERKKTSAYALQLIVADAAAAIERGTFDGRPDRYLVRTPGVVDAEGWAELNSLHGEVLDRTLGILAASAERMARSPDGKQIPVSVVSTFFQRFTGSR